MELDKDEYYIADLIGMDVFTEEGHFGVLRDVMETGANEVYIVDSDSHGEVLIPAIRQLCAECGSGGEQNDGADHGRTDITGRRTAV